MLCRSMPRGRQSKVSGAQRQRHEQTTRKFSRIFWTEKGGALPAQAIGRRTGTRRALTESVVHGSLGYRQNHLGPRLGGRGWNDVLGVARQGYAAPAV